MPVLRHCLCLPLLLVFNLKAKTQTIGTFSSVIPGPQTSSLVLPSTHTFQQIIRTGSPLTLGGTMGSNPDFTGYVPISGSSTNGYLSINSETAPAEIAVLSITFNPLTKLWGITQSGKVPLPTNEIGVSAAFCSGAVTKRNTVMVCEEVTNTLDFNGDNYYDVGWVLEIDPATRTIINQDGVPGADKLWAMGNQTHENVAINANETVAYWGADNGTNGFLYKFVPTVAGNFSAGNLFVLKTTGLGAGTWEAITNTSKTERNNTIPSSVAAGAYNFNRIEDVEIGPDGKIYFASTATGRIYRLNDAGTTVNNLEVFVERTLFVLDGTPAQFEWPDNLAFDGEGNLWVLQDGGNNHIWMVSPAHTAANPAIKVFANTPTGSEPTGITFSPDYKFMFISLQRTSTSNAGAQQDAAGNDIVFNGPNTLVIARKENLGNGSVLPLKFIDLNVVTNNNTVNINWKIMGQTTATDHIIERSVDGISFKQIGVIAAPTNPLSGVFKYTDKTLPPGTTAYYRIKACDMNNQCILSDVKRILFNDNTWVKIFPTLVRNTLQVSFKQSFTGNISIKIFNTEGKQVYNISKRNAAVNDQLLIPVTGFKSGTYILQVTYNGTTKTKQFIKQ